MATTLNTRIQLKYDTYENWTNSSIILKSGEVALVTIPTGTEDSPSTDLPSVMMKIGDGVNKFNDLKWLYAASADVYDWAKSSVKPSYSWSEINNKPIDSTIVSDSSSEPSTTNLPTSAAVAAYVQNYVASHGAGTTSVKEYQIISETANQFVLQQRSSSTDSWTTVGDPIVFTDTNTTYSFAEGTESGTFTVTSGGTTSTIKIHGLGSFAYKSSITSSEVSGLGTAATGTISGNELTSTEVVGTDLPTVSQVKNYVTGLVNGIKSFNYKVLNSKDSLGTLGESNLYTIYLIKSSDEVTENSYDEYLVLYDDQEHSYSLEMIGSTKVDLSGYIKSDSSAKNFAQGFYKIGTNSNGLVTSYAAVETSDITGLTSEKNTVLTGNGWETELVLNCGSSTLVV